MEHLNLNFCQIKHQNFFPIKVRTLISIFWLIKDENSFTGIPVPKNKRILSQVRLLWLLKLFFVGATISVDEISVHQGIIVRRQEAIKLMTDWSPFQYLDRQSGRRRVISLVAPNPNRCARGISPDENVSYLSGLLILTLESLIYEKTSAQLLRRPHIQNKRSGEKCAHAGFSATGLIPGKVWIFRAAPTFRHFRHRFWARQHLHFIQHDALIHISCWKLQLGEISQDHESNFQCESV